MFQVNSQFHADRMRANKPLKKHVTTNASAPPQRPASKPFGVHSQWMFENTTAVMIAICKACHMARLLP